MARKSKLGISARRAPIYVADPTFTQWLLANESRARTVAAFAIAQGARWPIRARTLLTFVRYVKDARDGAPSERALRAAYAAYERDLADGKRVPSRNGKTKLPPTQKRTTHSYSLAPATDDRIRRIQAWLFGKGGGSRGAVIDKLVEDYFELNVPKR